MGIVACIQMASGPDVQSNLQEAKRLIEQAVGKGAELVVLPENFVLMGMQESDKLEIMEDFANGPIQEYLAQTAAYYKVWIAAGTLPLKCQNPEKVRSALLLYNDKGDVVARYDKIHLFDVELPEGEESYNESATIEAGNEVVVAETPLACVGLSICYDLRFPEMFRLQLEKGMQLLVIPSAFTALTGKAHWEVLLRTRAIENQCYVAAANQGGHHFNGRETYGHSMIVNPWGVVLESLSTGAGFVVADINLDELRSVRQSFPVIKHRCL